MVPYTLTPIVRTMRLMSVIATETGNNELSPSWLAIVAPTIGANAPMMLPGRKKRANPMPRCLLGVSLAMIEELTDIALVEKKLDRK